MTRTYRYKNPWHKPRHPEYGPEEYTTTAEPEVYRGYRIHERITGHVWDVVKGDTCITQMAGPNGARRAIDKLLDEVQA
jgi:hypothetical protein